MPRVETIRLPEGNKVRKGITSKEFQSLDSGVFTAGPHSPDSLFSEEGAPRTAAINNRLTRYSIRRGQLFKPADPRSRFHVSFDAVKLFAVDLQGNLDSILAEPRRCIMGNNSANAKMPPFI